MRVTVTACARCEGDHRRLEFRAFVRPIEEDHGEPWTHWAMCPTTAEPLLLRARASESVSP